MILSAKARFDFDGEPRLAILESQAAPDTFIARDISSPNPSTIALHVTARQDARGANVWLPSGFEYLGRGDIVRLNPRSCDIRVLYRRTSRHNTLFTTERCNSRCVMCSQPPRDVDDDYLVADIVRMLPWMDKATPELGITGGEPTLLGHRLFEIVSAAKRELPNTALHLLSNGRKFADLPFAQSFADLAHPDLMVGIPLYADVASIHDYVVQAQGAFDETILGFLNLARVGIRIELRIVVHRDTYSRLPQLARYIARNLPFVEHVAFMGLEPTGFARTNIQALWIDPFDYRDELASAVEFLDSMQVTPRIYNHALCVLPESIRRYAVKSISDWKNTYLEPCTNCAARSDCGGFFTSGLNRHSVYINPIRNADGFIYVCK